MRSRFPNWELRPTFGTKPRRLPGIENLYSGLASEQAATGPMSSMAMFRQLRREARNPAVDGIHRKSPGIVFLPIIRGKRCSPNILRFLKSDTTVPGPVRIDVDHLGQSTLIRQNDMNLDSHPYAQGDGSRDQCSMTVDDDGLAFTGQRFSNTLGLDANLQANPRASSGLTSAGLGGHYATCLCVVEGRSSHQIRTPDDTSFCRMEADRSDLGSPNKSTRWLRGQ